MLATGFVLPWSRLSVVPEREETKNTYQGDEIIFNHVSRAQKHERWTSDVSTALSSRSALTRSAQVTKKYRGLLLVLCLVEILQHGSRGSRAPAKCLHFAVCIPVH